MTEYFLDIKSLAIVVTFIICLLAIIYLSNIILDTKIKNVDLKTKEELEGNMCNLAVIHQLEKNTNNRPVFCRDESGLIGLFPIYYNETYIVTPILSVGSPIPKGCGLKNKSFLFDTQNKTLEVLECSNSCSTCKRETVVRLKYTENIFRGCTSDVMIWFRPCKIDPLSKQHVPNYSLSAGVDEK